VIVVDGEADPMPMGRTERGPPAAVRDVFVGLLGGDKKAEQVEDRRSDGSKSLIMNEIGDVCVLLFRFVKYWILHFFGGCERIRTK
jgi:hypothetical protein